MNTLRVAAQRPSKNIVPVYWQQGRQDWQMIEVRLSKWVSDPQVAAELAVLHHLLLEREIAGHNRSSRNLRLECTKGAVRKLCQGRSTKKDLIPYAAFLRTRFPDAEICVTRPSLPTAVRIDNDAPHITLQDSLGYIASSRLAPVRITRHAVERYKERAQCQSLDHARKVVEKMLQSEALHRTELPSRRRLTQLLKHNKPAEIWVYHDWRLRIINDGGIPTLVTVYPEQQGRER